MSTELNLLPCPHCGTEATMVDQGTGSWRVACLQSKGGCGAQGRMTFDKGVTAAREWNRRASPAAAVPEGALPPLPKPKVFVKRSEWHDALNKRQSFNAWRVNYGDCDMHLYTVEQLRDAQRAAVEADRAQQGEPVEKVSCPECKGTGCGVVNAYPEAGGCSDCNGKGYNWDIATKAAAPADASLFADEATRLRRVVNLLDLQHAVPGNDASLRECLFSVLGLIARELERRAAPVPDTGIPTAGEVTFDAWFEEWRRSTWKPLPSDIANGRAACPEHWNTNPRRHMEIAWSAVRRAPVSGTPTSGAVEKAGEIARLKDQRDRLLAFIQNADVSSGVCCCGDSMEQHGNPMDCGHNPVDMWDHSVICWAEEIEKSDRAAPSHPSEAKAGEAGPWQVLRMEDQPEPGRLLDVVLTNGVTEEGKSHSSIDWTQVADWRYSRAKAGEDA